MRIEVYYPGRCQDCGKSVPLEEISRKYQAGIGYDYSVAWEVGCEEEAL